MLCRSGFCRTTYGSLRDKHEKIALAVSRVHVPVNDATGTGWRPNARISPTRAKSLRNVLLDQATDKGSMTTEWLITNCVSDATHRRRCPTSAGGRVETKTSRGQLACSVVPERGTPPEIALWRHKASLLDRSAPNLRTEKRCARENKHC